MNCPDCGSKLSTGKVCLCGWKPKKGSKLAVKPRCKYCGEDAIIPLLEVCFEHYEEKIGRPNHFNKYPDCPDLTKNVTTKSKLKEED